MTTIALTGTCRPRARWLVTQFAVVAGGITTYFGVRGVTESSPHIARLNAEDVVALERRLGLDHEAAAQSLVIGSQALSTLANWVYIWGHWPVIIATLIWLAVRHRTAYERLRNAMIASGLIGIVVFVLYPVAPPRLAEMGLVDTVTEQSAAYRVLQPPAFVNQYAAMPSLHVGWDLLVGLTVASVLAGTWLRWAARIMPMAMVLAVVVTANHYLLDVFAGAFVALVGLRIAVAIERRRTGLGRRVVVPDSVFTVPLQRTSSADVRGVPAAR